MTIFIIKIDKNNHKMMKTSITKMKPKDRQREIISYLQAMQREFPVEELAEKLHVSPLTIRRDLDTLGAEKAIVRTYGGCISAGMSAIENEYYKKVSKNYELKQAIGKAAAGLVHPGDVILINDGSTTYHLASHLDGAENLTVFTNSVQMISALGRYKNIDLYVLGGKYIAGLNHLSGSLTEQILEKMSFGSVFLGVDAIDPEGGCFSNTAEDARLAQIMLRTGRKKILLADRTKFTSSSFFRFAALGDFDILITNRSDDKILLNKFEKLTTIKEVIL
jgi:DeoR/GlpR family transcriptional regulator of sugar metabolism